VTTPKAQPVGPVARAGWHGENPDEAGSPASAARSGGRHEETRDATGPPASVASRAGQVEYTASQGLGAAARRRVGGALFLGFGCGVSGAVGVFFGVVRGNGWVWPLLFLAGAVVVGVLVGRRPWLVVGMVVATGALLSAPDGLVGYLGSLWLWLAALLGAAAVLGSVRRCVPAGATVLWHLALLLPRGERDLWRAEVGSVLHACSSAAERRRQVHGFLGAVPTTVLTSWRVRR
jgi:hypothetical protein